MRRRIEPGLEGGKGVAVDTQQGTVEQGLLCRPPGGVENKLGPILPRRAGGAIVSADLNL
jgi:hypothetical protein